MRAGRLFSFKSSPTAIPPQGGVDTNAETVFSGARASAEAWRQRGLKAVYALRPVHRRATAHTCARRARHVTAIPD
jgi:hypothetical protein